MIDKYDALLGVGLFLVGLGSALLCWQLGIVVLGLGCIAVAILGARAQRPA